MDLGTYTSNVCLASFVEFIMIMCPSRSPERPVQLSVIDKGGFGYRELDWIGELWTVNTIIWHRSADMSLPSLSFVPRARLPVLLCPCAQSQSHSFALSLEHTRIITQRALYQSRNDSESFQVPTRSLYSYPFIS